MATALLFLLPWLGVCGYALWRGGQPERLVGGLFLLAFILSIITNRLGMQWHGVEVGTMGVDTALLIALLAIALRANRYWPIGMAAMQLLQVMGHLLKIADPRMLPLLYWISSVVWAYPMLVLLWLGTLRHHNRVKRFGPESSWSDSSGRSAAIDRDSPIG
ncbi:MAG: hypothetical protein J0I47_00140 [Sphingomonas sp.]|uniref:hypothetical protein n=1 Tax=Sphingomonas sp. TaxID=28214 RepID=UPI001AD37A11|nr:hypothetical protein [Sphingomonas sp.]MBN8806637.1 hypothetical protein [Sphingomonas sp.]